MGPYSTIYHHLRSRLFLERRHLKKDSTQGLQWAYLQGFAPPEPLAEYALATRKRFAKHLKIKPRPPNTIDVVLKRTAVTGYSLISPADMSFSLVKDYRI
jgi:hypothetical protein